MAKKILFITPRFGKSGSEAYLHSLISRLNKTEFEISLLSIQHGELLGSIKNIKEYSLEKYFLKQRKIINSVKNKFRKRDLELQFFKNIIKQEKPDLVYINTLVIPRYFELVAQTGIKFIVHSHELEQAIFLNQIQNECLINSPDLIIGCSHANKKVLEILGRKKSIEVLPPAIDLNRINITIEWKELRRKLNIPEKAFIWIMSGSTDSNKNPVLFVEIANEILKERPDTYFIWIGGSQSFGNGLFAKRYSEYLNLSKHILWFEHINSDDYYNYLNLANSFVLTSKRDSFPLVMIENAYLGKPIVAFNSGGVNQFVNNSKIGLICNDFTNIGIIKEMLHVMDNRNSFIAELCKNRALEFDINKHITKWEELINSLWSLGWLLTILNLF